MTCDEIKDLTVPYLELDLEPSRVRDVTTHLDGCAGCRDEMEAVRQVLVRVKGVRVPDPGDRFWGEFPGQVRRQLARERAGGRSDARPPGASVSSRAWPGTVVWPLALAASVLLLLGGWFVKGLFTEGTAPVRQDTAVARAPRSAGSVMVTPQRPNAVVPAGGAPRARDPLNRKDEAGLQVAAAALPSITDAEWQQFWDDYHDMVLVEMASRLDPRTVDRLFSGI